MATGPSIRRRPAEARSDFEELRSRGVELIQELSGELWTDYNLHDPGITVLEQLCYGLTDLLYRADFPVADHLADEDGRIDFERQALHRPEVIFPSRPTTPDDYRKALLAHVPEVENVWVDPLALRDGDGSDETALPTGLYKVRVHLGHASHDPEEVLSRVRSFFHAHRNLGEDLHAEVGVVGEVRCELGVWLELDGGPAPEDILAEIYALAHRHVAGEVRPEGSGAAAWNRTRSLEEVFTGPLTAHGMGGAAGLPDLGRVHVADLVSLVRGVEGVASVKDLYLLVDGVPEREALLRVDGDRVLCLQVPDGRPDPDLVRLTRAGRPISLAPLALRQKYRELSDARRHGTLRRAEAGSLYEEPTGRSRQDVPYHSVQNHFPAAYGVNAYGIPDSAPAEERAKVAQLKAYLLPLEQILANEMAGVRHLRDLFSTDDPDGPTYWYEVLGDEEVPHVSSLYRRPPGPVLERLFRGMDDRSERRSRVLDAMLAVYGETFTQRSLRRFDHYYGRRRVEEVMVRNKMAYLRSIVTVGRDRGGAVDHTRPAWTRPAGGEGASPRDNISGFEYRVGLLLGFQDPGGRSLVDALTEQGMRLVSHDTVVKALEGRPELELVDIDETYEPVPVLGPEPGMGIDALREAVVPLGEKILSETLFTRGLDLGGYRVGRRGDRHVLVFRPGEEDRWWYVGDYADRETAVEAANALQTYLLELNMECEGFHVMEHVLLRPEEGRREHRGASLEGGPDLWADFFPLRVSVFFSGWTARCGDPEFRLLAEETVRLNCPAHVHATCHWLDFAEMTGFEKRYRRWLDAKADPNASAGARDERSADLIRFVLDREARAAASEGGS